MIEEFCPGWFAGFDVVFQAVTVYVTLAVAIMGLRIHRFFGTERYKLHAEGFILLAASYTVLTIAKFAHLAGMLGVKGRPPGIGAAAILWFGNILLGAFFVSGLTLLTIAYLRVKDRVQRTLLLVFAIMASLIATFDPRPWAFSLLHTLTGTLLIFIIVRLLKNPKKNRNSYLVIIAFISLVIGEALTSAMHLINSQALYVLSNSMTLAGYVLILVSLSTCGRHEKKQSRTHP
ncbi:hypothetical protein D6789_02880 [Candidatus Woesearchaeota archaeon]|nr:MAG: hypothetical protein D6789_02880 [Candidatus Woesearchaeota archaeon]